MFLKPPKIGGRKIHKLEFKCPSCGFEGTLTDEDPLPDCLTCRHNVLAPWIEDMKAVHRENRRNHERRRKNRRMQR